MRCTLGCLLAVACSDYGLSGKPEEPPVPPESTPTPPEPEPEPPEPEVPEPEPSCADFEAPTWEWLGSTPFLGEPDLTDMQGMPFWEPVADRSTFTPVALPDMGIPVGWDRAYTAEFELTELPYNLSLSLQSDDGLWLWLNGQLLGHWGGAWQQEGCVNENANCLVTSEVPPVDLTPHLEIGPNVLAARVSNPVLNAYFELIPLCVEP
jgi:hypothetical protein